MLFLVFFRMFREMFFYVKWGTVPRFLGFWKMGFKVSSKLRFFFFFSFCGIRICLRQSAPPHRLLFGTTFSFSFVQHVCGVPEIKEVAIWSIPRAPLKSCHSSGRQAGKGSGGCANGAQGRTKAVHQSGDRQGLLLAACSFFR